MVVGLILISWIGGAVAASGAALYLDASVGTSLGVFLVTGSSVVLCLGALISQRTQASVSTSKQSGASPATVADTIF